MITIDRDQCIKCYLCVSACLQSVLKKEPEGIQVAKIDCVDCAECLDICPVEAIAKNEEGIE